MNNNLKNFIKDVAELEKENRNDSKEQEFADTWANRLAELKEQADSRGLDLIIVTLRATAIAIAIALMVISQKMVNKTMVQVF